MHDAPSVPWDEFLAAFDWRQGEHVTLVGPTGSGKSHLARELLDYRDARDGYIVAVGTKPKDSTLAGLRRAGYRKLAEWPPPATARRVLLWPPFNGPESMADQREVIETALADIFDAESWCIYVDELRYVVHQLGLADWITVLWLQGRALGISLVSSTQRPRHVPVEAYSSSTHLFIWRTNDDDDLRRLGGLGAAHTATVRAVVAELPRYEFLYVDTRTGKLAVSKAPA